MIISRITWWPSCLDLNWTKCLVNFLPILTSMTGNDYWCIPISVIQYDLPLPIIRIPDRFSSFPIIRAWVETHVNHNKGLWFNNHLSCGRSKWCFLKITSITPHIGSAISVPSNGWGSVTVIDNVNFALRYYALVKTHIFPTSGYSQKIYKVYKFSYYVKLVYNYGKLVYNKA